jgi:hypothetical protein
MLSLTFIVAAIAGCALLSLVVIGVAWAISSNRKPPSP